MEKCIPKKLYHLVCLLGCDELILFDGLRSCSSSGIFITDDYETMRSIVKKGTQCGKRTEIRTIDVQSMKQDGFEFTRVPNGWRVNDIPKKYVLKCQVVYGLRDLKKTMKNAI